MRKHFRRLHKQYQAKARPHLRRLKRWRRHPAASILFGLVVLSVLSLSALLLINGHSNKFKPITAYIVIVSHDGQKQTVPTNEPTVGALLAKLDITLNQGDVVEPSAATQINEDNFRINVYRAVPVQIVDGDNTMLTFSAATTPRAIAAQAGVTVYPEDYINAQPVGNFLTQHTIAEQVVINRATPVNVNLYGTPTVIRTHATTVAALMAEKHIVLASGDSVEPAASTPLTASTQVFLIHKGTEIVTVQQPIPAPVQTIQDATLTIGTQAVRQQGSDGSESVTYQVNTQNGVEVSRTAIQTVVIQQPVPHILAVGSAPLNNDLAEWLYKLRSCESGGNYADDTGNGYYGAYQFGVGTWNKWNTGYATANLAPPEVQDTTIIENTNASSGGIASQNPGCYYKEGLSAFPPAQ